LIFALMLMLSTTEMTCDLTGVVNNGSGRALTFKSQSVKPVRVTVTNQNLATSSTGVFYNSNPSTTGYGGSVDYAMSCDPAKHGGIFHLSFHVTREKNEGTWTYAGDAVCESRCSVQVTPKSCTNADDCQAHFTFTIGNR
jgi:hypothetical protein